VSPSPRHRRRPEGGRTSARAPSDPAWRARAVAITTLALALGSATVAWLAAAVLALVGALAAAPAAAHGTSDAFLALEARDARIAVRWDLALRDAAALVELDVDDDGMIATGEWRAAHDALAARALDALEVRADGARCEPGPVAHALARRGDATFAVLRFELACPRPAVAIDLDYRLMADVDATHRAILDVGDGVPRSLRPGAGPTRVALAATSSGALAGFVADGVRHILDGVDHLAFVLALALGATAAAAHDGAALRPTLARLLGLVTLFTVAHSITLAGGALGWLGLPSRWVETAIAASVAAAGVQAWAASRVGRRADAPAWLVFAFGLVHGFGFGAALAEAGFGGRPALLALLGFNLGVEAGQVAVLGVAFPLFWALRGARAWRTVGHPALAAAIVAAGLAWLATRALDPAATAEASPASGVATALAEALR
jgi:hypothetical protein